MTTISLADLKSGTIELGYGITLTPIEGEDDNLVAVRFSHVIQDDGELPRGTCSKIIPIRVSMRGMKKKDVAAHVTSWKRPPGPTTWVAREDQDGLLRLSPSLVCEEHGIHGWIQDGRWFPMREWSFDLLTVAEVELAKIRAERIIREYGGGYEGAVLALAARLAYKKFNPIVTHTSA